jgi:DNA-binding NarL/FixJ family response regulator
MAEHSGDSIGVLLVDDQQMFAESLSRLLDEERDVDVLGVAGCGVEAIELAARLHPAVVLVDYHLPDLDGVEVTARLKELDPRTKVVMLTGSADDSVLLAAVEVGCSGFLTKDQAASEVASAVRSAAAGEVLIAPSLLARLLPQLARTTPRLGADITGREREVLELLTQGLTNKVIAEQLHLSVNTIRNYVQTLLTKLDAHSKLEAVSTAVREGIIKFPTDA